MAVTKYWVYENLIKRKMGIGWTEAGQCRQGRVICVELLKLFYCRVKLKLTRARSRPSASTVQRVSSLLEQQQLRSSFPHHGEMRTIYFFSTFLLLRYGYFSEHWAEQFRQKNACRIKLRSSGDFMPCKILCVCIMAIGHKFDSPREHLYIYYKWKPPSIPVPWWGWVIEFCGGSILILSFELVWSLCRSWYAPWGKQALRTR